jgi:hypothetical protein
MFTLKMMAGAAALCATVSADTYAPAARLPMILEYNARMR